MKCQQPGCTGTIVDGYCDVCGMAPAAAARAPPPRSPSSRPARLDHPTGGAPTAPRAPSPGCTGTIVDGYCDVCGTPAGAAAPPSTAGPRRSDGRLVGDRLVPAGVGGHRLAARRRHGATHRVAHRRPSGCASARLGAGLTTVPPGPAVDAAKAS